jgi:Signal transduction histidine kinase
VLVSGVAHELNNPLQAILGTLELLERDRGISPAVLEEIAFVKTQSGRAREIIRNLSRFSSQQAGPPTLIDLGDVVSEVVQLRRRDLDSSNISLSVDVQTNRKVYANFTEVEQVTLNFVINAQQSIEVADRARGRILIRVFDAGKRVRRRGTGRWARREARGRAEAVSTVFHDEACRQGDWSRSVRELRHRRVLRRHHRASLK